MAVYRYPVLMSSTVINFLNSDIRKLIVMQKPEQRTAGPKLTKIKQVTVDRADV